MPVERINEGNLKSPKSWLIYYTLEMNWRDIMQVRGKHSLEFQWNLQGGAAGLSFPGFAGGTGIASKVRKGRWILVC